MAYTSYAVANAFLDLARGEGKSLTNMQLQKLVYFAHGYTLALINAPLIDEEVKAWTFGPVIPPLYNKLKRYGRYPVEANIPCSDSVDLSETKGVIVSKVWDVYKKYSASQLSTMSHLKGSPWHQTWEEEEFSVIQDMVTREYFLGFVPKKAPENARSVA